MTCSFVHLPWDSAFFGLSVAQVSEMSADTDNWFKVLKELQTNRINLAYWQVPFNTPKFSTFAENNKGLFVDSKTTYALTLSQETVPHPSTQICTQKEADNHLLNLAVQCGKFSRFSVDNNIPHQKFVELYQLWLKHSLNKTMADDTLLYYTGEQVTGLVTVSVKNGIGQIGLVGVDELFRGQGIGKALMQATKHYFRVRNIYRIEVVTQGQNIPACKLYESEGFVVTDRKDFYHFWL